MLVSCDQLTGVAQLVFTNYQTKKSYFFQPVKNVHILLLNKTVCTRYINCLEITETDESVLRHQTFIQLEHNQTAMLPILKGRC